MKKKDKKSETVVEIDTTPTIESIFDSESALYLFHSIIDSVRNTVARNKLNKNKEDEKSKEYIDILRFCSLIMSSEDKKKLRKEIEDYNSSQCHMFIEDVIKLETYREEIDRDWLQFFINHLNLFEDIRIEFGTNLHYIYKSIRELIGLFKEHVGHYKKRIEEKLFSYYSIILPEELGL